MEAQETDGGVQLSLFELFLPLPYRVVLLVNLGIWLWYVNLKTCYTCKIDTLMVLKLTGPELNNHKLVSSSLSVVYKVTAVNLTNYFLYLLLICNGYYATFLEYLPLIGVAQTFAVLLMPYFHGGPGGKKSPEMERFTSTLKRITLGNIDSNLRNNDILLSDTFTSYSKVLVDFLVYVTALLIGYQTLPSPVNLKAELSKDHLKVYNLDIVLSMYPSLIRLKQCLFEYEQSRRRNRQHLLNAIKYSTSFLPLIANLLIRSKYLNSLALWYLAVFINSTYTFIWDVKYDWNFEMFNDFLSSNKKSAFLRNKLIYKKSFYYVAILLDFQLRFIWVYRLLYPDPLPAAEFGILASLASSLYADEIGNFVLEVLEIFRRWVWMFLKIETEYVKAAADATKDSSDLELQAII